MNRILVTGATGTVGRQVVSQLLTTGTRVRALTRNPDAAELPPEVDRGHEKNIGERRNGGRGSDQPASQLASSQVRSASKASLRRSKGPSLGPETGAC